MESKPVFEMSMAELNEEYLKLYNNLVKCIDASTKSEDDLLNKWGDVRAELLLQDIVTEDTTTALLLLEKRGGQRGKDKITLWNAASVERMKCNTELTLAKVRMEWLIKMISLMATEGLLAMKKEFLNVLEQDTPAVCNCSPPREG